MFGVPSLPKNCHVGFITSSVEQAAGDLALCLHLPAKQGKKKNQGSAKMEGP